MSDRIQMDAEALSALMDGELSDFELRRLLAAVADDPELLASWQRYNLVRAAYQPEPLHLADCAGTGTGADSLSERIMAAIEAEPALSVATPVSPVPVTRVSVWNLSLTRMAVAASVAFAVFIGMQSLLMAPQDPAAGNSVADQSGSAVPGAPAVARDVQLAVDEDAQRRLNEYIRSVSIPSNLPGNPDSSGAPYNILLESPMLRPVSDLELIGEVEREQ